MNSMGIFIAIFLLFALVIIFLLISIYGWIRIIDILDIRLRKSICKGEDGNIYIRITKGE